MTIEPAPWAMQLAVRVEKTNPPTTADVCAAALLAVIELLDDERARVEWAEPIEAWQGGGRIRKLVRRARGSSWQRAQEPDGYTAECGQAAVRAFVPSPMDQVPDAVAKLQIKSTGLDEPDLVERVPDGFVGMVVVITPVVDMSWGKQAAQCAHGGQLLWRSSSSESRDWWRSSGSRVLILHAAPPLWEQLDDSDAGAENVGVHSSVTRVHDGGFTEIPAGTLTAMSFWSGTQEPS
jgi:peptidyl-tRNA hydrolase